MIKDIINIFTNDSIKEISNFKLDDIDQIVLYFVAEIKIYSILKSDINKNFSFARLKEFRNLYKLNGFYIDKYIRCNVYNIEDVF